MKVIITFVVQTDTIGINIRKIVKIVHESIQHDSFVIKHVFSICQVVQATIQEVFHVYLNKFENVVTHLFLVILGNN